MDGESCVAVEVSEGIATLTINRPKALNALNSRVLKELGEAAGNLARDDRVRAVIVTGSGDKAFVAGADIAEMKSMTPDEAREFSRKGQEVMAALEDLPRPVIAAVNGFALGGGCELAMACDLRIASDRAKFGQPEVGLGIPPGFGGTQRLPRLVGAGMAKTLIFTGKIIDAAAAEKIGLVDLVVPHDELMKRARETAALIAEKSPSAVSMAKRAINRGEGMDIASACAYESEVFAQAFSTWDQEEGMSAFLEKRKPRFSGVASPK